MKDFLQNSGVRDLFGSKDATREAFKQGLIQNGEIWMEMIKDRNLTSYTYNEEVADKIASAIIHKYYDEFLTFLHTIEGFIQEENA